MNISGGEISGNRVNATNEDLGFDGGGGVYVDLYATLDLSGTAASPATTPVRPTIRRAPPSAAASAAACTWRAPST